MLVHLIKPPELVQDYIYSKRQKGEIVDKRSLIDRVFNWNKDQIYVSQGEGYLFKGRVRHSEFTLQFEKAHLVPLNEKIESLDIAGFVFKGVIPTEHLPDGNTLCICDCFEKL